MDWFNAIRAARFHYLQVAFPGASDADVSFPDWFFSFFLASCYQSSGERSVLQCVLCNYCAKITAMRGPSDLLQVKS